MIRLAAAAIAREAPDAEGARGVIVNAGTRSFATALTTPLPAA